MTEPRSRAFSLGLAMLGVSLAAAVVIYYTHPIDPHDEGLLVGTAAFLWPFLLHPLAWLACVGLVVADYRRHLGRRALGGLLAATAAWPVIFVGYYLNQKPWLSPRERLEDSSSDVRARGAALLGQEGAAESLPLIAAALTDRESEVRAAAATALARYGLRAEPAIPALVKALDDEDWFVACQACEALGAIRGLEGQVLPPLLARASTGEGSVSWCAVKAISRLGPAGAQAVPTLRALLGRDDPNLRSAAAEALGRIGPASHSALPDLEKALDDENEWVRKAAQAALPSVRRLQ